MLMMSWYSVVLVYRIFLVLWLWKMVVKEIVSMVK